MDIGSNVEERTDRNSLVRDLLLKNHFLDLDEKEFENINKGCWRVNKHVELWVRNVFDECKVFRDLDITISIVDLLENEYFVKDLVDMLSSFVLQVAKKDGSFYAPTR
jgi:hypothetical protein